MLPPRIRPLTCTCFSREAVQHSVQADLRYQLNTVELQLPPLRRRGEDLRLLPTTTFAFLVVLVASSLRSPPLPSDAGVAAMLAEADAPRGCF